MTLSRAIKVRLFGLLAITTVAQPVAGQTWDVDVHGGPLMSSNPANGTSALPPSSAPIVLIPAANLNAEPVPSWFFGDGAALLTQVSRPRLNAGIVALDPVLESRFVERRSASSIGARI